LPSLPGPKPVASAHQIPGTATSLSFNPHKILVFRANDCLKNIHSNPLPNYETFVYLTRNSHETMKAEVEPRWD